MSHWTEILDHGDDPGRYTVIRGNGQILTCNENGLIICQRKCHNPRGVVSGLCREKGIRIVRPADQIAILKKVNLHLKPEEQDQLVVHRVPRKPYLETIPSAINAKLLAYMKKEYPQGDLYTTRISWNGNYVVTVDNDYPHIHGIGFEKVFTPDQINDL